MSRKSRRKSSARKSSGSRFFKWLAIGGGLFVVLAIVGVVLGYRAVRSYLKSDDFRVMLEEKASDSLGGQATFQPFDWAGWSLTTNEFQFAGEEAVTNLRVSNIGASVDIGAVWDGIYRIENVSLRQVELTADLRGGDEVIQDEAVEGIEVVPSSGDAGFFDQFIPKKVEITGVDIAQITGMALTDDGEWSFDGISAALRPGAGDDIYDLSLDGGTIKTPISLVEELNLRELRGRYSGDRFYLLSSQFDILERGTLTASGEYDIDRRAWSAQGKMTGVRAEEIVLEDWKQRLMGALEVDFKLRGEPEQDAVVSGSLELNQGILTALPILDRIAAYTNAVRFRHLALSEASLDFRKEGERIEFTKIKLASEGLVRIEGRLTVEGNVIREGNFRVGITPGTLAHIPGAETTVFQRGELGLLWAPMRVSGTLDAPKEDLSDRLIEAAGLRMFEMIPATGEWVLKNTNKVVGESTKDLLAKNGVILGVADALLQKGTGAVKDAADQAIDEGKKAAEDAVKSIFDILGN
ncbi:AsmA-like C-terminal region-containing protein [bacterium]|nr:AsmA-like C-terminal region-containing protein [Akkermansiaceae bacterium]MDB4373832.1 AsmA-like C-terminal region-containing protein [Akkermansiaceae bacterium]MDB4417517.1 AsmA-like C-terminal region-containing protein [bacterium]